MAEQHNAVTTLRHFLTQEKPSVSCVVPYQRHVTKSEWPEIGSENQVSIWTDFNLDALNEEYGEFLDTSIPSDTLPLTLQLGANISITNPSSIRHLIAWNDATMVPSLKFAKSHFELCRGIILRHRYNDVDQTKVAKLFAGKMVYRPDHLIELDQFPATALVVGLGRPSSHWSARKTVSALNDLDKECLQPLRELANLCRIARAAYGYIQTDEDMVVCHFKMDDDGHWKASIMPIPWSTHASPNLTTDLALWWLCMRAMSESESQAHESESESQAHESESESQAHESVLESQGHEIFELDGDEVLG